jgi:hypothetical protein
MADLKLDVAFWDYDRTRALAKYRQGSGFESHGLQNPRS